MSEVIDITPTQHGVNADAGGWSHAIGSQWFHRPDDQKFLDLDSLHTFCKDAADNSFNQIVDVRDIKVSAQNDDPENLDLIIPGEQGDFVTHPNHYSFGQICQLVKAPAKYLRTLPGTIAGINLQWGISEVRSEAIKVYATRNGNTELRAATGPDYGRIYDHAVVDAVRNLAGNGAGDTCWTVPGLLNSNSMIYDTQAPITKQTTTLFASDRDVFLFLVDHTHPIKVGTFRNKQGELEDDIVYRGFYVWNSEVGNRSFGIACFYFRASCANRMLWGVEGYQEIRLTHSKNAPRRFLESARPALQSFIQSNDAALIQGVQRAKEAVVAYNDDDRESFLRNRGFNKKEVREVINCVVEEEGDKPKSVWQFVQGITAHARSKGRQDERLDLERKAGKLLDKVA